MQWRKRDEGVRWERGGEMAEEEEGAIVDNPTPSLACYALLRCRSERLCYVCCARGNEEAVRSLGCKPVGVRNS
eukprot:762679-Hanusia_phi.AAC.7